MKYIRLVDREGQFNVNTQSSEDLDHLKDSGSQRLFRTHLGARFCTASSRAQSFAVWGFHTVQAYSILGLTILLYATSLASIEQPNIVRRTTFRSLVAFKAIILQWSDYVNLELMYILR